jgi:hypothetical protein
VAPACGERAYLPPDGLAAWAAMPKAQPPANVRTLLLVNVLDCRIEPRRASLWLLE